MDMCIDIAVNDKSRFQMYSTQEGQFSDRVSSACRLLNLENSVAASIGSCCHLHSLLLLAHSDGRNASELVRTISSAVSELGLLHV